MYQYKGALLGPVSPISPGQSLEAPAMREAAATHLGPGLLQRKLAARVVQRQAAEHPADTKPKIAYKKAEQSNEHFAASLGALPGWEDRLETIANGAYKHMADLWKAGKRDEFADAVAAFQMAQGWSGVSVDGILGLATWSRMAGLGEAMAGIGAVTMTWPSAGGPKASDDTCHLATKERIYRGYELSTGERFTPPAERQGGMNVFDIVLASMPERMLDVELQYRGTGGAGAMVLANLADFVDDAAIFDGGLQAGATIQVWKVQADYDRIRAGEIEEMGKKRRINAADLTSYGTSFVFVKYGATHEELWVRHYGTLQMHTRGEFAVWKAANPRAPQPNAEHPEAP